MVPGDRRRRSHLQSTSETEVPSPISTATPAPLPKGTALVDLSEADPSDIIILFI